MYQNEYFDTKIGTKKKKNYSIHLAAISSDQLSIKKPQYEVNILVR